MCPESIGGQEHLHRYTGHTALPCRWALGDASPEHARQEHDPRRAITVTAGVWDESVTSHVLLSLVFTLHIGHPKSPRDPREHGDSERNETVIELARALTGLPPASPCQRGLVEPRQLGPVETVRRSRHYPGRSESSSRPLCRTRLVGPRRCRSRAGSHRISDVCGNCTRC